MSFILKFLKTFILSRLTTKFLENMLKIFLFEIVKRTDTDIDNKIYHAFFHQTTDYEDCDCSKGEDTNVGKIEE